MERQALEPAPATAPSLTGLARQRPFRPCYNNEEVSSGEEYVRAARLQRQRLPLKRYDENESSGGEDAVTIAELKV